MADNIPWPRHSPITAQDVDSFRVTVLGILKPGRRITAKTLAQAALGIVGPTDADIDFMDLIQRMLDLAFTVGEMRLSEYGSEPPGKDARPVDDTANLHPFVRSQLLVSAIVQEITARLPDNPQVVPYLDKLAEPLSKIEGGIGWFWPHLALMLRAYMVRMNWISFIEKHFNARTRALFESRGLMLSAGEVDAYAADLMAVRTHGLQSCYLDKGLLIPKERAWVYMDALPFRKMMQDLLMSDLLGQVAFCFLADAEDVADLSVIQVRESARNVPGLKLGFKSELQFIIRLDGHLDIGEISSRPLEDLFEKMGCAWAYQPFRLIQLMRLYTMIVCEDAARPATGHPASRKRRKRRAAARSESQQPAVTRVPADLWLKRFRHGDLGSGPDILAKLAETRTGVHGYGPHHVPGFFCKQRPGTQVMQATIDKAIAQQGRAPRPGETYIPNYTHCQKRTGPPVKSHRARIRDPETP